MVEELCERLTLTELEQEELLVEMSPLDEVLSRGNQCLVIKLCTRCPFNKEAFKAMLRKIWQLAELIYFHKLGFNLLLAEFEDNLDKNRVLCDSPWSFDRNLILLQDFDGI